jgi:integrase
LAYAKEHRAYETYLTYVKHWQRYLKPWAGNRPLRAIRRHDVTAFHEHVGQNHGRITANRVMALLRAIINRAIREYELDIPNPARGVSLYRETKRIRRLEPSELPAFFRAMEEEPNPDMRDFFLLALFTGARKGNLMSMRWEDINFERSLWIVPAAKSKTGHQLFVVLSSHAMTILVQRRAEAGSSPYAFPGKCDGHIGAPSNAWARILQRAGLEDLHIHDLRRSLASFQIDTGTPLEVIQKTLGHESKVTTEIYARLALDPVRASVERATEEMLKAVVVKE